MDQIKIGKFMQDQSCGSTFPHTYLSAFGKNILSGLRIILSARLVKQALKQSEDISKIKDNLIGIHPRS